MRFSIILVLSLFSFACAHKNKNMETETPKKYTAKLSPSKKSKVSGEVIFEEVRGSVRMTGEIKGLGKGAAHAIHVHEFGVCALPDFKSAGNHFNPEGHSHGGPEDASKHVGDLGNIQADANGVAKIDANFNGLTFSGVNDITGRALVVHAKSDDLKSQPSGNSGDRIACGIISTTH